MLPTLMLVQAPPRAVGIPLAFNWLAIASRQFDFL